MGRKITVGVLALQGAFSEHLQLLLQASKYLDKQSWTFIEVRTAPQLDQCDALIIPGGESTAISLVAQESGLLEPLRNFVKVKRKPTWGTCAGLILLAESANRTKKGGQELIGGLDVRVNRNHFGRQTESFTANLNLPFLAGVPDNTKQPSPFPAIFIRAPIVEAVLTHASGIQEAEANRKDTVVAPSRTPDEQVAAAMLSSKVEVLAALPKSGGNNQRRGDIVAVQQGNCFGTSFHPELTGDARIHAWWLQRLASGLGSQ